MIWPALGDVLPQAVAIAIGPIPIVLVIIVLVIIVLVSTPGGVKGVALTLGWVIGRSDESRRPLGRAAPVSERLRSHAEISR